MITVWISIKSLSPSKIIRNKHLTRSRKKTNVGIGGLTAAAHELFFTDYKNNVVRSFNVHSGRLDDRDVFEAQENETLSDLAYSAESDILLVATQNVAKHLHISILLFTRANESYERSWSWKDEYYFIYRKTNENNRRLYLRVLRKETYVMGLIDSSSILFCIIYRKSSECERLELPEQNWGFDVQAVGDETRLAAAHVSGSVALYRVEKQQLNATFANYSFVKLSEVLLANARHPLFFGDKLLVGVAKDDLISEIASFSISNAGDLQQRGHWGIGQQIDMYTWCFVNGSLFAWDSTSGDLLQFDDVN